MLFFKRRLQGTYFDLSDSVETLRRFYRAPSRRLCLLCLFLGNALTNKHLCQVLSSRVRLSIRPVCENTKQCLSDMLDELTLSPDGVFFRRFLACLWSAIGLLAVALCFLTASDLKRVIRQKRSRSSCPFLHQAAVFIGSTPAADPSARICRKRPEQAVPFSIMTMTVGWTFIW